MHSLPMHKTKHIKQTIAANLFAARTARGLTQEEVATATGATQDQVSKWERGLNTPGFGWQSALADLFFDGDVGALYREPTEAAA